ncbi:MAG: hypothetical protein KGM16_06710 [Bacteroidota bacterium]|nr:hypothetical protein [Bacteroidota bacterium]
MEHKKNIGGEHIARLRGQLRNLGMPQEVQTLIDHEFGIERTEFTIPYRMPGDASLVLMELNYRPDESGRSSLDSINISYRRPIEIENFKVENISTTELDKAISAIDWSYNHFSYSLVGEAMKTRDGRERLNAVTDVLNQLDRLGDYSAKGKELARLLMYKHWTSGYYQQFVLNPDELKSRYEKSVSLKVGENKAISITDLIRQLKEQSEKIEIPRNLVRKQTKTHRHSL